MPLVDGRDVARQLKADADTRQICIAIVTASRPPDEEVGGDTYCDAFLHKPLSRQALFAYLRLLLPLTPAGEEAKSDASDGSSGGASPHEAAALGPHVDGLAAAADRDARDAAREDAHDADRYTPLSEADRVHLARELERIAIGHWQPLRQALDIESIEDLLDELSELAAAVPNRALQRYCDRLDRHLQNFGWAELPEAIEDFASLRDAARQAASPKSAAVNTVSIDIASIDGTPID